MIEGLHFDIAHDELKGHLLKRVEHHRNREMFYETQINALKEGKAEAQQYTNGDPIRSLTDSKNTHSSAVVKLQFMADHLIEGETYRLKDDEMKRIEIFQDRW